MGWVDSWWLHPRLWWGGGLGGNPGGTVGGTLGGVWWSSLPCSVGNGVVLRVRLGGGVGVGVGAPVAAKMSANCQMESIVWVPKQAKGEAGAGLARVLERRLAESVAASAEDIAGMAPLWGKTLLFLLCALPVSPGYICSRIGSGVGPCQCNTLPCHGSPMFESAAVSRG